MKECHSNITILTFHLIHQRNVCMEENLNGITCSYLLLSHQLNVCMEKIITCVYGILNVFFGKGMITFYVRLMDVHPLCW